MKKWIFLCDYNCSAFYYLLLFKKNVFICWHFDKSINNCEIFSSPIFIKMIEEFYYFTCNFCDFTTKVFSELKTHVNSIHFPENYEVPQNVSRHVPAPDSQNKGIGNAREPGILSFSQGSTGFKWVPVRIGHFFQNKRFFNNINNWLKLEKLALFILKCFHKCLFTVIHK